MTLFSLQNPRIFLPIAVTLLASYALGQVPKAETVPSVNPGRPTVADPAALTAPNWIEVEFGIQRTLDPDAVLGSPLLLKFTTLNERLQYRVAFDGYLDVPGTDRGFGDSYFAMQYLIAKQGKSGYDVSVRGQVKFPTANSNLGTGARDYSGLLLASKDYSNVLHADFNLGVTALSRSGVPGYDNQLMAAASFSFPNPRSRWGYTNEIVYYSPTPGSEAAVTTLHGFTYAVNGHDVYDIGVQLGLQGDVPKWQLVFGRSWMLGHVH